MPTLEEAIARFGVPVEDHLDLDLEIPVLSGLQFQGDVAIIPASGAKAATTPVPPLGVAVVRGENGGNTHTLLGSGDVYFDVSTDTSAGSLALGTLTVPEGSTAYFAHPEHAYAGVMPGTYTIGRQREKRDEIRVVAD